MLARPDKALRERLAKLESHLENENPLLLDAVVRFKKLDRIAYRMGLLKTSESYATRIPWWPLVTVLGTFSAGKSSFINHFLGQKLQLTGNQAVDEPLRDDTVAVSELRLDHATRQLTISPSGKWLATAGRLLGDVFMRETDGSRSEDADELCVWDLKRESLVFGPQRSCAPCLGIPDISTSADRAVPV